MPRQLRYWDGRTGLSEHVARPIPIRYLQPTLKRAERTISVPRPSRVDLAPNQPGQRLDVGGLQWTEPLQPSAPLRSVGVYRGPKGAQLPPSAGRVHPSIVDLGGLMSATDLPTGLRGETVTESPGSL